MARSQSSATRKIAPATDVLLMATPTKNADLRWFSGFHASDPFPAFSVGGRKVGLLPLLEVGRAKQESAFDEVLNLTEIIADLRQTNPTAGSRTPSSSPRCSAGSIVSASRPISPPASSSASVSSVST